MIDSVPDVLALLIDESEPIRIKDKPSSSAKEENIELRREINAALAKIKRHEDHRIKNILQYGAAHLKSLDEKIDTLGVLTELIKKIDLDDVTAVIESFKKKKKRADLLESDIIRTLVKASIVTILTVIGAGIVSIILGIV